ncbi:MAG: hypothetical protein QOH36_2082 [Actinomycetota bacterium]|nr:hypothetical protein [Actinomycetota bacterium]
MPEADALVTVGIPTYNREHGLVRAVESVLAQTHAPIDVVICDNASTDGTAAACASLVARHPNVRYLRQETNVGATGNFNRVFGEARTPYFMWLGDDDWLDESYVAACLAVLEADPGVVLTAGTAVYHRDDDEVVRHGVVMNLDAGEPADRVAAYFDLVEENGVFYGLARTDALRRALPLANEMGGDWFVVARLAYLGRIRTLPEVAIHRAVGGATRNLRHVAESAGLGRFQAAAPQVALAAFAARDVGRSPVYADLPVHRRAALAARCAATVTRRFLPGAIRKWVRQRAGAGDGHSPA